MDPKLFASTFAVIFLAELGDKTQLATLTLSAGSQRPVTVFVASGLALVASSLVAVLVGSFAGHLVEGVWLKRLAGILFILLGLLYVSGRA